MVKSLQPSNAYLPMLVTLFGIELMVESGLPVYEYAIRKDELWVSVETYLGL